MESRGDEETLHAVIEYQKEPCTTNLMGSFENVANKKKHKKLAKSLHGGKINKYYWQNKCHYYGVLLFLAQKYERPEDILFSCKRASLSSASASSPNMSILVWSVFTPTSAGTILWPVEEVLYQGSRVN